jgi:uncharacterized membrane protein YeiB
MEVVMLKHLLKNPKNLTQEEKEGSLASLRLLAAIIASVATVLSIVFAMLGAGASSPLYYAVTQAQIMLPRLVAAVPLVAFSVYFAFLIYQAFENSLLSDRVVGHETNYLAKSIILSTLLISVPLCIVLGVMGRS